MPDADRCAVENCTSVATVALTVPPDWMRYAGRTLRVCGAHSTVTALEVGQDGRIRAIARERPVAAMIWSNASGRFFYRVRPQQRLATGLPDGFSIAELVSEMKRLEARDVVAEAHADRVILTEPMAAIGVTVHP